MYQWVSSVESCGFHFIPQHGARTCDWSHIRGSNINKPISSTTEQTLDVTVRYTVDLKSDDWAIKMFSQFPWYVLRLEYVKCGPCVFRKGHGPLMELWEGQSGAGWTTTRYINSQSSHDGSMTRDRQSSPFEFNILCKIRTTIHDESQWGEPGLCRFRAWYPQDKLLKGPDSSSSVELQGGNSRISAACWQRKARKSAL